MLLCILVLLVSGCVSEVAKEGASIETLEQLYLSYKEESGFPETITATVRDIIDGDTIDVSLEAYAHNGEITLPEYKETTHARIRMLGINAPEKSPKGEILCSDVEIYKVDAKYADLSRERLLPLNDKEVTLRIDPDRPTDAYGRILALIEHDSENICLRQIREGLACGYYREDNKYIDTELYRYETFKAKESGTGMWGGLGSIENEEDKIRIIIDSIPSNAQLYIDGIYTHHRTPSDEQELSDVMHLLSPGEHVFKAMRSGLSGEVRFVITPGENPDVMITLESTGQESNVCVESWNCSEWGECKSGHRARLCYDENHCGSYGNKPPESKSCETPQNETQPAEENTSVIINEIIYDSLSSYDQHGEFIELFNAGSVSVNLSGWQVSDGTKTDNLTTNGTALLEPGMHAVITGDNFNVTISQDAIHLMTGHSVICSYGLSNSGEIITIKDRNGAIIDTVNYAEYTTCDPGHSLVRDSGGWVCSTTGGGTPGF